MGPREGRGEVATFVFVPLCFADVFQVVCVTSKNAQHRHGLKVDVVRGMVNALCSQLMYTMRKPVDGGWEQHLGYDPAVSPIQGARAHFLTSPILDLQERFARGVWVQQEGLPLDWIEASSCSCERVFPFVTSHNHGQSTQHMCEVLWIRCNGPCVEEWCPGEVLAEPRGTQFRP